MKTDLISESYIQHITLQLMHTDIVWWGDESQLFWMFEQTKT